MFSAKNKFILIISVINAISVFSLFVFFYQSEKANVLMIANREMSISSQTFEQVVDMKKLQLKRVAETISQSVILKSATVSKDQKTIEDAFVELAKIHNLEAMALLKRKKLEYYFHQKKRSVEKVSELIENTILSTVKYGKYRLLVAQKIEKVLLDQAKDFSKSEFFLLSKDNKFKLQTEEELPEILHKESLNTENVYVKGKYYVRHLYLFKKNIQINIYKPTEPFWSDFKRKRNRLGFFCLGLFIFGIAAAAILAKVFYKSADQEGHAFSDEIKELKELLLANERI